MNRLSPRTRHAVALLFSASVLLLRSPAAAIAQDGVDPLSKLDANSKFSVQLMIDSAHTEGLPTHPLQSTATLGISRKADGKKIVEAVRRELACLRTARVVLGAVSDEELSAAADVLKAGAKPAQLAAFRSRPKGRTGVEAFVVWTDLVMRGVSSEDVSSAITKLWQDGADDATLRSLWSNVQSDISLGLNPGAALQNRIRETPAPGRTTPKVTPPEG